MQSPLWFRRTGNLLFAVVVILIVCLARSYREEAKPAVGASADPNVLETGSEYNHIAGFGGPVPVKIILDPGSGTIRTIDFPPNAEDPDFWQMVLDSGVFKKYLGKTPVEAARLPIDAVTGATFSSRAAQETIRARLEKAAAMPAVSKSSYFQFHWLDAFALLMLAVNLVAFFFPVSGKKRVVLLICNVAVFGFLTHCYLSLSQFAGWLNASPHWKLSAASLIFLITVLLSIWRGRNLYCGSVCPYGCAQELASRLGRKLGAKAYPAGFRGGPYLRRLILGATVLGTVCGMAVPTAEPFSAFLIDAAWWVLALAVVFLLVSVFLPRLWCRWFCGCGALLDFFTRITNSKNGGNP